MNTCAVYKLQNLPQLRPEELSIGMQASKLNVNVHNKMGNPVPPHHTLMRAQSKKQGEVWGKALK